MRFGDHMQKTPLLVIREMPGGQLAQLFHAIALERLAEGMEAQPMQCVRAGGAAGIVLGPDVARLLSRGETVRDQKHPALRYGNAAHRKRREVDQNGAAAPARKHRGMVHAAAARADEILALRQDVHQFFKRGLNPVGPQQRQRESGEQR